MAKDWPCWLKLSDGGRGSLYCRHSNISIARFFFFFLMWRQIIHESSNILVWGCSPRHALVRTQRTVGSSDSKTWMGLGGERSLLSWSLHLQAQTIFSSWDFSGSPPKSICVPCPVQGCPALARIHLGWAGSSELFSEGIVLVIFSSEKEKKRSKIEAENG